jgi:phosphohistidine phosphatase SixA
MLRTALVALSLLLALPANATEAGWALLREGGRVVLMRHAYASGAGEPANFDIAKCNTQRNLSDRGRQQARRIGSLFAARAAPTERVLSSRLCRALDTARIAFGDGDLEELDLLDPVPADEAAAAERKTALLGVIGDYSGSGNLVMITDLSVIQALTGGSAREGEALIVTPQDEGLHVSARILFN